MPPDALEPPPLHPPWWLPNGHLETVVPAVWPTAGVGGGEEGQIVRVSPEASVLLKVSRPAAKPRGTLLLVHGLVGSADAHYMRVTARLALARPTELVSMMRSTFLGWEPLSFWFILTSSFFFLFP